MNIFNDTKDSKIITISSKISKTSEEDLEKYGDLIKKLFPEISIKAGKSYLSGIFIEHGLSIFRKAEEKLGEYGSNIDELWDLMDNVVKNWALGEIKYIFENLAEEDKIIFRIKINNYKKNKRTKKQKEMIDEFSKEIL